MGIGYLTRPLAALFLSACLLASLWVFFDALAQTPSTGTTTSPIVRSCRACAADRDACFARCDDKYKTNADKMPCVNACNAENRCVMGSDCK